MEVQIRNAAVQCLVRFEHDMLAISRCLCFRQIRSKTSRKIATYCYFLKNVSGYCISCDSSIMKCLFLLLNNKMFKLNEKNLKKYWDRVD